ncbi:MAG: DUF805 domain-containing protein [Deltaproteobacteria bacterium]|nr:DUF805 domain-containing protein [Deltaproteobacteria bacterium]
MSKPVLEDLFTFSGRRNRKSYNLYQVAMALIGGVGELIVASGEVALVVIGVLVLFALGLSQIAVVTQRFRDFGWTGWTILVFPGLVLLVVLAFSFDWGIGLVWLAIAAAFVVTLALMCVPGNRGDNDYGPDPLR